MATQEQQLTIGTVMEVLQDIFGYGTALSSTFIREVRVDTTGRVPTLGIDGAGVLHYDEEFFREHVNTERKLKEVIFHELLHPVLGDMHRRHSFIANLASDIVINSLVAKVLGHADLMQEFYKDTIPDDKGSVEGLLRPQSNITADGQKFANLYHHMWKHWGSTVSFYDPRTGGMRFKEKDVDSIEEVREIMEILLSRHKGPPILLIGSHGHRVNDQGGQNEGMGPTMPGGADGLEEVSGEMREIMADEIGDLLSKQAGYGDHLTEMAIKAIRANVTMVRKLLEDFSATSEFNSFMRYMKKVKRRRTVFPKKLSRRDAVLLAAGANPVFYQSPRTHLDRDKDGMNWYIDVSGSMWSDLPQILGLLRACQKHIDGVYQFSNQVVPTSTRELFRCNGKAKINSTGGTDYNCIIDHAVGIGARKIVVLTDGYASCDVKRQNVCLANIDKACVIYSEHHAKDEFWKKNYHQSYKLSELFKGC